MSDLSPSIGWISWRSATESEKYATASRGSYPARASNLTFSLQIDGPVQHDFSPDTGEIGFVFVPILETNLPVAISHFRHACPADICESVIDRRSQKEAGESASDVTPCSLDSRKRPDESSCQIDSQTQYTGP